METTVEKVVLGTSEARPEWMSDVQVENHYSDRELNPAQYEYILTLEQAARQLELFENGHVALRTQIELLEERLATAHRNHEADIKCIGDRLMAEAEEREWCNVYDEVISELNRRLHVELPVREREYTVEVEVTGTLRVLVVATSESDAQDIAESKIQFRYWDTGDSDVEIYDGTIDNYRVLD